MPRVIHFEIHASDPDRAIAFYTSVFGWHFSRWEDGPEYWVIQTGAPGEPGIDGGLVRRRGEIDGASIIAFVCTVDVPSVDDYLERILRHGGESALPKLAVSGVGWVAYAKDPEGNLFGIMERNPGAR